MTTQSVDILTMDFIPPGTTGSLGVLGCHVWLIRSQITATWGSQLESQGRRVGGEWLWSKTYILWTIPLKLHQKAHFIIHVIYDWQLEYRLWQRCWYKKGIWNISRKQVQHIRYFQNVYVPSFFFNFAHCLFGFLTALHRPTSWYDSAYLETGCDW